MDRYRIAPSRPVCYSAAAAHLRPAAAAALPGRRQGGAEIGIFTAERYFASAADAAAVVPAAPPAAMPADHDEVPLPAAADAASQSGRTAASSEASWNSRSGLLPGPHPPAAARQHRAAAAGAVYGSDQGYHHHHHHHRGRKAGQRWTLFGRDCPCAGRKAVTVDAASEPRSPAAARFSNARFSPPSAVDECLESDIFKAKKHHLSHHQHQEFPARAAAVKRVTVTPGSLAFPLAAGNAAVAAPSRSAVGDAPFAAFKAAGIGDRRAVTAAGGRFAFPAAARVLDEPPRVSLEVFRPIDEDSVMLADPPPPAMPFAGRAGLLLPPPPPPAVAAADEEAMSDASSDLFDLESFAASSSYPTTTCYRGRGSRRNSADDDDDLPYGVVSAAAAAGESALSECMYPASEASVVWSVATAEGGAFDAASVANFSSAASACYVDDDLRYVIPDESPEGGGGGFTAAMSRSAGRKKSGGGGFLNSCRCEKAVSVGPTPVRVVRPPAHPGAAGGKKGGDGAARHYYHPGRAHVPVRT
ncbi:unnamed protein product [Urochloa humidicola]